MGIRSDFGMLLLYFGMYICTLRQVTDANGALMDDVRRRQTSCLPNEYGENCTYCTPKDSCIDGHYSCDFNTGNKVCLPGWTGDSCRIKIDPDMTFVSCPDNQCRNGGLCVSGLCCCVEGFTGILCEIEIIECTNTSCKNEGICKDLIGRYECLCKNGFTGLRCEIPPNSTTIQTTPGGDTYCQSDTCLNNGTCFEDALFTYCLCPTWFTGTRCEKSLQKMLPTTNNTCPKNHYGKLCEKICVETDSCGGGHYVCDGATGNRICRSGWQGERCDTRMLPQTLDPYCPAGLGCKNDGQCDKGSCCCRNNYSGELCQIQSIGCISNPCINNSTCIEDGGAFKCNCVSGYTGKYCELTSSTVSPDNSAIVSPVDVEKTRVVELTSTTDESSSEWGEHSVVTTRSVTPVLAVNPVVSSSSFRFENSITILESSFLGLTPETRVPTSTEAPHSDLTTSLSSVSSYGGDTTENAYTDFPSESTLQPSSFSSNTFTGNMLPVWSSFDGYYSDTISFNKQNYRSSVTDKHVDFSSDLSKNQISGLSTESLSGTNVNSVPITTQTHNYSDKSGMEQVSENSADLHTSYFVDLYNSIDIVKSLHDSTTVTTFELSVNPLLLSTANSRTDSNFKLSDTHTDTLQLSTTERLSISPTLTTGGSTPFSGTTDFIQHYGPSAHSFLPNVSTLPVYDSQTAMLSSSVYSFLDHVTDNTVESVSTSWEQMNFPSISADNSVDTSTISKSFPTSQIAVNSSVPTQSILADLDISSSYTRYVSHDSTQAPSLSTVSNKGNHPSVYLEASSSPIYYNYLDADSTSSSAERVSLLGGRPKDSTESIIFTDSVSPYLLPVSSLVASQTSSITISKKPDKYSSIPQHNIIDLLQISTATLHTSFPSSIQDGYSNLVQSLSTGAINSANITYSSFISNFIKSANFPSTATQPNRALVDASLTTNIRNMTSSIVTTLISTSKVTLKPLISQTKPLTMDDSSTLISSTYTVKSPERRNQADDSLVWWIVLIIVLAIVLIGAAVIILTVAVVRKRRSDFRSIEQNPDAMVAFDKEHFSVQPEIANPTYEPDDDSDDDSVKHDMYIVNR